MALFTFARGIIDGTPIQIYNEGRMTRHFTFIDDLARAVLPVLGCAPAPDAGWDGQDPSRSSATFRVVKVGGGNPVPLEPYLRALERALGRTAVVERADAARLAELSGVVPTTSVEEGVAAFVEWYRGYYGEP